MATLWEQVWSHVNYGHIKLGQAKTKLELATPDVAGAISTLASGVTDMNNAKNKVNLLGDQIVAKDGQIASLTTQVAAQADIITAQDGLLAANAEDIGLLNDALDAKDAEIVVLQARIAELEAGSQEPEPDPEPEPEPDPAPFQWPNVAGVAGVPADAVLTAYTGPTNITANGTVIENKTINQMLVITGADCVIRNSRIQHNGMYGINADGATRLLVERTTIVGPGLNGQQNSGILGWANIKKCDISGVGLAMNLKGTNLEVTGNHVHDLGWGGPNPHYDGIAFMGGTNGALVKDNYIHMPNNNGTASVFVSPHAGWGNCTNIVVDHNTFLGSPGYAISIEKRPDGTEPTGCVVTNNFLQRGDWGYIAVVNCNVTRSGNVDATSGASV